MIHVHDLCKTFRVPEKEPGFLGSVRGVFKPKWQDKHALKNVSFDIGAGEIVGLVGANGAGKTTLVKILSGIVYPSSGQAEVLGFKPWQRKNDLRCQISLIMGQKAQLWWDLPAADCFLLLREIYNIPQKDFDYRVNTLAELLDVKSLLKTQIRRLSLGERMKMELMAALLHAPKVVYLDEPTIGLDFTAQRTIREFILSYSEEHKPAMILTSHYMEDIESLCERIIIIREGEFVYDGSLADLSTRYAPEKIIRAKIAHGTDLAAVKALPADLGELCSAEEGFVLFRVAKSRVADAAAAILKTLPVLDLTIEDEDIAHVIETIMKKKVVG